VDDFREGMSIIELAEKYKLNYEIIIDIIRNVGIIPKPITAQEREARNERIAKDFGDGMSINEVAIKYVLSIGTVRTIGRKMGVYRDRST